MEGKNVFIIILNIYIFILTIIHFISFFFIKKSDFENIIESYEFSPLFDFTINIYCGFKSNIIFHKWEGRKRFKGKLERIEDKTEIVFINGVKFCYNKENTYKDLLYNDQIINENETCKNGFKSCGIIDTLNQILCVENNETCPLYDVKIGYQKDKENEYIYDPMTNISYNNENYKGEKKIIGKIILNDGQPCLSPNEKLWKKFNKKEAGNGHLKCKKTIKNYKNDVRYEEIGKITYKKLYEDNLNTECKDLLLDKIKDEQVSLYKREFIGINKLCDEKSNFSKNKSDKLRKNQQRAKNLLLIESIFLLLPFDCLLIIFLIIFRDELKIKNFVCIFAFVLIFFLLTIIFGIIFLVIFNKMI